MQTLNAQITPYIDQLDYYSGDYYVDKSKKCYVLAVEGDTIAVSDELLKDGYLQFSILNTRNNIFRLHKDDNGLFFPYQGAFENMWYPKLKKELTPNELAEALIDRDLNKEIYGAIHILRDQIWPRMFKKNYYSKPENCIKDSLKELIIFERLEEEQFGSHFNNTNYLSVDIELFPGDSIFYSRKIPILCPEDISDEIWADLQARLIALDYLNSAPKISNESIRKALIKFQIDNQIWPGFLDEFSMELLELQK